MRHETQSEDASLEENSKRLKWQNFSVPDTAAKRGLSFKGRYFSTIGGGERLSVGEISWLWMSDLGHSGHYKYTSFNQRTDILNGNYK